MTSVCVAVSMAVLAAATVACTRQAPDGAPARQVSAGSLDASTSSAAHGDAPLPPDAAPAADTPSLRAAAPADPPLHVKLVTIGMHVGGGPCDEVTKEPMKRSVEPRFADLARCWEHVPRPRRADIGVDLVIEASGGRAAEVSNPRSTIEGEGFVPCIVTFFEGVDFQRPKNGKTVVSYSARFLPRN